MSRLGKTKSAISKARAIIMAVSMPNVENMGIGAKAITMNPRKVVNAVQKRANPVL